MIYSPMSMCFIF